MIPSKRSRALSMARRRLGVRGGKMTVLCALACQASDRPTPIGKAAKWDALEAWVYSTPLTKAERRNEPKAKYVYRAPVSDDFLQSYAWRALRMKAIIRDGRRCACCGRTPDDGITINVDHILPRRTHPELALSLDNLQVLCNECNHGKGNWDTTNWKEQTVTHIWNAPKLVKR